MAHAERDETELEDPNLAGEQQEEEEEEDRRGRPVLNGARVVELFCFRLMQSTQELQQALNLDGT